MVASKRSADSGRAGRPWLAASRPLAEVGNLVRGRLAEYAVVALFVLSLAVYEWFRWAFGQPPQPVLMSVFASLMLCYLGLRIWWTLPQLRAVRADLRAQEALRTAVRRLGDRGFFVFEPPGGEGIELRTGSVVVGPTGIFALTVRHFSRGRGLRERIEEVDPGKLAVGGREVIANPISQARGVARWFERLFEKRGGEPMEVCPLLVCPGWEIGSHEGSPDVGIVNEETLVERILGAEGGRLEAHELIAACETLDELVRGGRREADAVVA